MINYLFASREQWTISKNKLRNNFNFRHILSFRWLSVDRPSYLIFVLLLIIFVSIYSIVEWTVKCVVQCWQMSFQRHIQFNLNTARELWNKQLVQVWISVYFILIFAIFPKNNLRMYMLSHLQDTFLLSRHTVMWFSWHSTVL